MRGYTHKFAARLLEWASWRDEFTTDDVMRVFEVPRNSAAQMLSRMVRRKRLIRVGCGIYRCLLAGIFE